MRRSTKIAAPLLAATAVTLLSGCSRPEMKRCVDAQNVVVADDLCTANGEQRILGQRPSPPGSYRYYYGGEGTHKAGSVATGGSYISQQGHSYERATGTRRKGFGGSWPGIIIVGLVGAALVIGAGE